MVKLSGTLANNRVFPFFTGPTQGTVSLVGPASHPGSATLTLSAPYTNLAPPLAATVNLTFTVASANGRPTAPTYAVFDTLSAQLDKQLAALKTVLVTDLPKLNAILKAAGRPEIVPRAEEPPKPKKPTITASISRSGP